MRVTKKNLLDFLKNETYVRVKPSSIHGVGLFAIRDIPKGVNPYKTITTIQYFKYSNKELQELPEEIREMIGQYCAEDHGRVFIPSFGFNPIELGHFINHSENPNVETFDDGDTFFTTRIIHKGEELFSDFRTYHHRHEPFFSK